MRAFAVHNRIGAPAEQAVFVREGFSLGAFLFTVLWALLHRMWLAAGVLLLLFGVISWAALSSPLASFAGFVVSLLFGLVARDLQAWTLTARGLPQIGLSRGRNLEEAELRYYMAHPRLPPVAVPAPLPQTFVPQRSGPPDTLGIFSNV